MMKTDNFIASKINNGFIQEFIRSCTQSAASYKDP